MGFCKFILFLFISVVAIALIRSSFDQDENNCPVSSCTESGLKIHFPFRIEDDQPIICGYPGFNLKCSDHHGPPFLTIPESGDFLVRHINYSTQQIQLYDSNNCLPRQFLNSDLTSVLLSSPLSPFKALRYQNYTFLSCPKEVVLRPWSPHVIECLSNSTYSVLATSSVGAVGAMINKNCQVYAKKLIPVSSRIGEYEVDWFSSDLNSDLHLKWDVPDSRSCEAQGLTGGFKSYKSEDIICYSYNEGPMDVGYEPGPVAYYIFMFFIFYVPNAVAIAVTFTLCCGCVLEGINRRAEARKRSLAATRPTTVVPEAHNDIQPDTSLEFQDLENHTEPGDSIPSEETPLVSK